MLLWVCVYGAGQLAYLTLGAQKYSKVMQISVHVGGRAPALRDMEVREIWLSECNTLGRKMNTLVINIFRNPSCSPK